MLTTEATEGPFLVSLSVQGSLDSQRNEELKCEVEGQTTIISIIDEGTLVKGPLRDENGEVVPKRDEDGNPVLDELGKIVPERQGDLVCELDASALEDKRDQQEITVTQAEAARDQAIEALRIQRAQNESDIAAAKLKLDLAELDRTKYIEGEYPQLEKEAQGKVELARDELLRAQENYLFVEDQVKKGFKNQNDLESARIGQKQKELSLQGAEEELKVLQKFTKIRQEKELEANAEEYKLEVLRTEAKAKAAEAQYVADVAARELTYKVEKETYEKILKQISACKIFATQDGEVVYANMSSSSRRSSEPVNIEEGATVRERQAIINLPDVESMKVSCRIHESLIGAVRKDLPTRIRIDAYPGQVFNGVVASVSSVPMAGSWPNTDLREYATEIHLTDDVDKIRKLRPGLTAQVEILIANRAKVLQVPVQTIVTIADKRFAYVVDRRGMPERREVETGQSNQSHVEIVDGIAAGEDVVMNPRSRFADEISELEAELSKEEEKGNEDIKIPDSPASGQGARPQGQRGPGGGGKGGERQGGGQGQAAGGPQGGGGGFNPAAFFKQMDKDGDGAISKDEAPDRMKDRFDTMDADKDGKITQEEFSNAPRPGRPAN